MKNKMKIIFIILGLSLFILSGCVQTEKKLEDDTGLDIDYDPITNDCLIVCPDGTKIKCGEECNSVCCEITPIVPDADSELKVTDKDYCLEEKILGVSRKIVDVKFCRTGKIPLPFEQACERTGGIYKKEQIESCACPENEKFVEDYGCSPIIPQTIIQSILQTQQSIYGGVL